ncbi:hypothetical protein JMJ35_002477 [Cladonia borealis]|uniref:Uncharacterized protein n=1 Tax=Cladonia borealis TaxID=184061 RepID=A0AA39V3V7_9LECA|nr:hypothetical protein JMJ35_002477 [Cladonia borealis]
MYSHQKSIYALAYVTSINREFTLSQEMVDYKAYEYLKNIKLISRLNISQLTPTELLFQLKSFTSHPLPSISEDPGLRNQLYYAAQAAMVSFEDNPDPISRVAVAQQAEWVAMCTSYDLGLYPALAAENEPKTLAELARATGADPTLLRTSPEVSNTTAAPSNRD